MPFIRHDLTEPLDETVRGAVVAVGNFDGVHRGHRAVLDRALVLARETNRPALVLSFEPHPRTLFKPESPVFRLTPEPLKARLLEAIGFDGLITLPFTREVAGTSAEAFVSTFLLERLGAAVIVAGYDFHFGAKRSGTPERLVSLGRAAGIEVTLVDRFDAGDEAISSSRIRRHLGAGEMDEAASLLGYRWIVAGDIVRGAQLGRTLGFPTANIVPASDNRLRHGVYAVRFRVADDLLDGVASWGRRPTFEAGDPWLETFVFDFDGDLYGRHAEVSLFAHLRDEVAYGGAEALVDQMHRDAARAREVLDRAEPVGEFDRILNFPL